MFKTSLISLLLISFCFTKTLKAQETDGQLGGWYAYLWNTRFSESQWGLMGDLQYRSDRLVDNFSQYLLRAGINYSPEKSGLTFLTGYAYIDSGAFNDSDPKIWEHRLYQDVLFSQLLWQRLHLGHRLRFEERFVRNQDFRTRFRYFITARLPFNKSDLSKNALFAVALNETFINGQKQIGDGRTVGLFDRNRFGAGLGYSFTNTLRLETLYMRQSTENLNKGQLWFMLYQNF